MRSAWILVPTLALAACGREQLEAPGTSAADFSGPVVARWEEGQVMLGALEERVGRTTTPGCRRVRNNPAGSSPEEIAVCYREVAERLAVEQLALADVIDVERAIDDLMSSPELRGPAYLESYRRRLDDAIDVGEEDVAAHYEANSDRYRRSGRLTLWNLFRRHEDPGRPERTYELLRDLRRRVAAGESFASLARRYSHSETRLRDGLVGTVSEGELPARLESVAFSLADGEVSEPIPVEGGAVLLSVRNVVPGIALSLEDVRGRIRAELRRNAIDDRTRDRIAGREPPSGSVVLDAEALVAAVDGGDPGRVVLDLAGVRLTVEEIRRSAGLTPSQRAADLDREARHAIAEGYRRRVDQQLLVLSLEEGDDPTAVAVREEAETRIREAARARLVDERLREAMRERASADPTALRRYYEDNRHHYQTPLRVRVRRWSLPFGDDPPRQLVRMERLRGRLEAGSLTLEGAARELGGSVTDLGWRAFDDLGDLPQKARSYLLQSATGGYSVPYQDDDTLHVLWLEAREEPRLAAYEEVAEEVRADYLRRFDQRLYREVVDERLEAAAFRFDEEALRAALLGEPSAARSATPSAP